jgi:putative transcriptional regulator
MSISFKKLFDLLQSKGHSSTYWLRQNGFHSATVTKLKKNQTVNTDTIDALCDLLNCQPGDIMEFTKNTNDES